MLETINRFFKKHPKLSYISLAAFLILVEVGFSYCSKKKCGGFVDANFDSWFPHKEGQTLYFLSNINDRDTFAELTIDKSVPYETGGGYAGPGACESYAYIQNQTSTYPYDLDIRCSITGNTNIFLVLKGVTIYANGISDSLLNTQYANNSQKVNTTYFDNFNLNGFNFNKVQLIEIDTIATKNNGIYKIWLAKNVGIVGYESYPSLERWAKQ